MTPYLIQIDNPLEPHKHRFHPLPSGISIAKAAERFAGNNPDLPTLLLLNGVAVLDHTTPEFPDAITREYRLKPGDMLTCIGLPGDFGVSLVLAVLSLVIAVSVVFLIPTPSNPAQSERTIDPAYTIKGQSNRWRLGEPVEVHYGRARVWPSYAAQPYNYYDGNNQYQVSLFCWGHGEFEFHDFLIEDSPLDDFADVQIEVIPPGGSSALYPGYSFTSQEVQGIELYGTNEDEYGTDGWSTPFVLSPSGTTVEKLVVHMTCPQGLFAVSDGHYVYRTVSYEAQHMLIDDSGDEIGTWTTFVDATHTSADPTPQRFSMAAVVPSGRYKLRMRNKGARSTSPSAMNLLHWDGALGLNYTVVTHPDMTLVALRLPATSQLNDSSRRRLNGWATRKLPKWDATLGWSTVVATRNPVWAFCDIFRSVYGGNLADEYLQMDDLLALAQLADQLNISFDWTFDTPITAWEAARVTLQTLRAVPVPQGSIITAIRDEPETYPAMMFVPDNIIAGSLSNDLKLFDPDAPHSVEVEYFDPESWVAKTVVATLPGFTEDVAPRMIKLPGCTSRDLAYQTGMYHLAVATWQNESITLETGLEGLVPAFGALVEVSHPTVENGTGGAVLAWDATYNMMELSEPVDFEFGRNYAVLLRDRSGAAVELPLPCGHPEGGTGRTSTIHVPGGLGSTELVLDLNSAPSLYIFGEAGVTAFRGKLSSIRPVSEFTVRVEILKYDSRVYQFESDPAPSGGPVVHSPQSMGSPGRLRIGRDPIDHSRLILRWRPVLGAFGYRVEYRLGRHGVWGFVGIAEVAHLIVDRPHVRPFRFRVRPLDGGGMLRG